MKSPEKGKVESVRSFAWPCGATIDSSSSTGLAWTPQSVLAVCGAWGVPGHIIYYYYT